MTRDNTAIRVETLERRVIDLSKALGSQANIVEELRASHDHSIRMISDAIHRTESLDLGALLASIEYDPERAD